MTKKNKNKSLDLKKLNLESSKFNKSLSSCFGYCFYKAAVKMKYLLNDHFLTQNLILPQLGLMMLLKDSGPMSQITLGEQLDIDKATMVKLIDGLENKKYVFRSPSKLDRRIKLLAITNSGINILDRASDLRLKIESEFLSPLTAQEKKVLLNAIPKLL